MKNSILVAALLAVPQTASVRGCNPALYWIL
jgi:hypothetical protein